MSGGLPPLKVLIICMYYQRITLIKIAHNFEASELHLGTQFIQPTLSSLIYFHRNGFESGALDDPSQKIIKMKNIENIVFCC